MNLLTSLLLVLVLARLIGQLLKKLGQAEVVGEILAGLILGSAMLGVVEPTPELAGIAELAVFLVIFAAGLEMEIHEIVTAIKGPGLFVAVLGVAFPILAAVFIGSQFQLAPVGTAVLGLCLAVTALPVTLRLLETMGLLGTELSHNVIGAAIVIDIIALLGLGVILDIPAYESFAKASNAVFANGGKMVLFFLMVMGFDQMVTKILKMPRIHRKVIRFISNFEEAIFGLAALFVLVFSSISELLGFHFVIGAFFGGLLLSKDIIGKDLFGKVQSTLNSVTGGFLAPIFFAYVGLRFSAESLGFPMLILAVLFLGYFAKTLGAGLGAFIAGLSTKESLKVGLLMNGRGVMDLVVAEIALEKGLIGVELFSTLVILGIVSTFVTPMLAKPLRTHPQAAEAEASK